MYVIVFEGVEVGRWVAYLSRRGGGLGVAFWGRWFGRGLARLAMVFCWVWVVVRAVFDLQWTIVVGCGVPRRLEGAHHILTNESPLACRGL